jgi:TATA-box binding protein (TBP) (component of TFIID and TFIIIB)
MGCKDPLDATFLALKYTTQIDSDDFPQIQSQSYTSRLKLGYKVNLMKLATQYHKETFYEPELFCAVRMCKYKPLSVNVFSSGSIVVCGLKEPEDIYDIVNEIDTICKLL